MLLPEFFLPDVSVFLSPRIGSGCDVVKLFLAGDELSPHPFFESLEIFDAADPSPAVHEGEFNGLAFDENYFT